MLKRKISSEILDWINNNSRALLIDGARQVGKTTVIQDVLKNSGWNFIEFNLLRDKDFLHFLENVENLSNADILAGLSVFTDKNLKKNETIIFIDEIQICKEMITKVKFLVEESSFKYIFSGSILGVTLTSITSAPVGYLDILKMYPMDFEEFLWSQNIKPETIDVLKDCFVNKTEVLSAVHQKMIDMFYKYLIIGGMPAAVQNFCDNNNYNEVHKIHKQILLLYKADIAKYQQNDKKLKLMAAYDLVPAELNKQNKRYTFKNLNNTYKFDRYEATFEWLNIAELTIPVFNVLAPEIPLLLNEKSTLFKLYLNDVGLLTSMYGVSTIRKILNREEKVNYGAIYENFVAQELHAHEYKGYYYKNKKYGELDFVIEENSKVLPIEVKSGKDFLTHRALNNVMSNKNYDIQEAFVLSNANLSIENFATLYMSKKDFDVKDEYTLTYLPIYMTMFIDSNKFV